MLSDGIGSIGDWRVRAVARGAARGAALSQVGLLQAVEPGEDGEPGEPIDFAASAGLRNRITNTASEIWTATGGVSLVTDTGHLDVSYTHYDSALRIPVRYAAQVGQEQEAPTLDIVQNRVDLRGEVETGGGFLERIRVRAGPRPIATTRSRTPARSPPPPSGRAVVLPCFQYQQADARFYGFEVDASARLARFGATTVNIDGVADYTRATIRGGAGRFHASRRSACWVGSKRRASASPRAARSSTCSSRAASPRQLSQGFRAARRPRFPGDPPRRPLTGGRRRLS